jgi:hypothetical protein
MVMRRRILLSFLGGLLNAIRASPDHHLQHFDSRFDASSRQSRVVERNIRQSTTTDNYFVGVPTGGDILRDFSPSTCHPQFVGQVL